VLDLHGQAGYGEAASCACVSGLSAVPGAVSSDLGIGIFFHLGGERGEVERQTEAAESK